MAHKFGTLLFTPLVKALQEKYGSRRQYARMETGTPGADRLGPAETEFIRARDSFYMASVSSTGWPYVQHRGGPPGFVKVIDERTIAFPDYRGNRQYISTGNLAGDDRIALIMIDYPAQARLKILGHARTFEAEEARDWMERVREKESKDIIERVYVIQVEAYDWNCPQHITPRFTEAQIQDALQPLERRMEELSRENQHLRAQLDVRKESADRLGSGE